MLSAALSVVYNAVFIYSTEVYPKMSPSIGGGNFPIVQLVTDTDATNVMQHIVPMANDAKTQPLKMLEESTKYYIVAVASSNSPSTNSTCLVEKTLVKGIVSLRP